MHSNIPLPVVGAKLYGIPPIRIKAPVREPGNFRPGIKPTMQKAKEPQDQEKGRGQHEPNNREHKVGKVQLGS